ncbi:hypothetical protein COEREDRAFT_89769 [Coemansia reversa NRRL 1564]|uniref:Uncharacterized protein n=1 Tax=Coemansia reversa (strain ATCC 12441 / NRRL 1564) TaxID=763665 RepID=A0A2G5B2G3_COERN|nr:hypothetical protein COEREDRAFT_89769 [Coemansia reversa NRRL 1564]|eukprot:PIA13185.1 hypothetical protein COEREDRAFT_89769 [Coemansia reversa NRRL 1564]
MNIALVAVAIVLVVLIVSIFLIRMYVLRRKKGSTPSEKPKVYNKPKSTKVTVSSGGSPLVIGANGPKRGNRPVSMSLGQHSADGPAISRRQVQQNLQQVQERERERQVELQRMMDRQREQEERERDSDDSDHNSDEDDRRPHRRNNYPEEDERRPRRRDVRFEDDEYRPRRRDENPDDEERRPRHREPQSILRRQPPDSAVIDLASLQAIPSSNARQRNPAFSANPGLPGNYPMGGYMQYPGMYGAGMFPGQMPIVGPTQSKKHSRRREGSGNNISASDLAAPQVAHMPGYPMPYFHPGMWMGAQQNMPQMPQMPAGYNQNGPMQPPPNNMPVAASMPVSPTRGSDSHRETQGRASADDNRRRIMHDSIRPEQDTSDARPDSFFPPELANTFRNTDNDPDDLPPSYQSVEAQHLRDAAR